MTTSNRSLAVQFSDFLHKQETKIASALPAHITAGRMISASMAAFNASDQLQKCAKTEIGRASIIQSIMVAATVGLEPGVLGQAYLIPYYSTKLKSDICTFVPGWKGIISVIGRSGKAMARSGVVFKGDDFDYDVGTAMFIKHKPLAKDRAVGKITHVYAIGEIAGLSDRIIEVWSIEQVAEHFRRYNKQGEKHYAAKDDNWEMYARKVPLLQVAKYLPQTVEITNVVAAAYTAERNENLIVDEQGVPLNADFKDEPPMREPKPEIKQPRRRDDPPPAQPKIALATDKHKETLRSKAGKLSVLVAAMKAAGIDGVNPRSLVGLTLDGYTAIKDELK